LTIENTANRAPASPYPEAAYDTFDRLQRAALGDPPDYNAALAELATLRAQIGEPQAFEALHFALQAGPSYTVGVQMNDLRLQFRRLCDDESTLVYRHHVVRVAPDGSSTDVEVKTWREHETRVHAQVATFPYWHETITETGPDQIAINSTST